MKATCTWGDGPDVLLEVSGTEIMLYENPHDFDRGIFGYISQGSAQFTASEARALAAQLIAAAEAAEEYDRSAEEYCREHP